MNFGGYVPELQRVVNKLSTVVENQSTKLPTKILKNIRTKGLKSGIMAIEYGQEDFVINRFAVDNRVFGL